MEQFFEEDPVGGKDFRKKKERTGIKGYWLLLICIVVLGATLWVAVLFRQSLPPMDFFDAPERVTAPATTARPSMDM